MPRSHVLVVLSMLVGGWAHAQALPAEVDAALARAKLPREALVAWVAPVEGGTGPGAAPRVAHRADQPVNPASLAKLTTTFAALELLGPGYTWTTPVYVDGPIRDGVLQGSLYLKGQGDPKLVAERLWLLMRRVQGLGIRSITGDIVLDRSAFEVPPADPGAFDGEPLRPYNAQPDALLVNFKSIVLSFTPLNGVARVHVEPPMAGLVVPPTVATSTGPCDDWRGGLKADFSDPARVRFVGTYPTACGERVWPVAAAEPATFAARAIAGQWRDLGGQLGGTVRDGRVPPGLKPVFEMGSPPLAEVVRDVNKFSNNVMAQQLFLTLGWQQSGRGTLESSRAVVGQWWRKRFDGEPPAIDNGSGLSRQERVSAKQLAQLLQAAWGTGLMPDLAASLPLSGQDGTLRRARIGSGLAHLKTGSLRDVAGVAGYVHGTGGKRWVLVAIANHPNANAARPAIEALVDWTARQP